MVLISTSTLISTVLTIICISLRMSGRVWLGITWPATQTALTGTSDFAEGSAISVNWLGLCMISLFVNLLWAWTAGHSDAPTNQTAHQAQPTPQTELQPACKHGTKLPFWKWAAAVLLVTVCIRLGSTSVYVQTVSPEAAPVSPQQTSLTLLESTAAAHTVPFHAKEIAVSESSSAQQLEKGKDARSETPASDALALEGAEPASAEAVGKGPKEEQATQARPRRLHLVAAEWGTSVESLQVQRQCGPEWRQAVLEGRPAPDCKIIPNSTSGLGKSDGWTGVGSVDYMIDWYLWACWRILLICGILMICLMLWGIAALVAYMFWVEFCSVREWMQKKPAQRSGSRRQQGRRTRPANQALQAKETSRGPATFQALHADTRGVAAATTVSADASSPSSIFSSALDSASAPVSSALPSSTNPAGPPPTSSETAPPPSASSHTSTSPADVFPLFDGTDTTKTRSDHTYEHEVGAANGGLNADACLGVNHLFTPREPSPESQTPSGDASEVDPAGPMLLDPTSVSQTLMGIQPDSSHTPTDEPHGTAGTLLEGPEIASIDLSVSPAVLAVPVDSQTPMSVAVEDTQTPLDPQAAKSTQAEESLTPVDGPLGELQTLMDISSDSQAPMITQSGDLLTPAGGTPSDVEFPMDDCSGAFQSLMAPPAALLQSPITHPSDALHTSTQSTALAELTSLSPEPTVALDDAFVVDEHMVQVPQSHPPELTDSDHDSARMLVESELESELQCTKCIEWTPDEQDLTQLSESELESELQCTECLEWTPDEQDLTRLSAESEPGDSVDEPSLTTSNLTQASPVTPDSPLPADSSPPGAELPMLTQPSALNACTEPIITPSNLLDAPSHQSISAIKQDSSHSISPSDPTHSKRWKSANDVSTWSPSSLPAAQTAGVQQQLAHLTAWGGENIYSATNAGLVTAKKAGHRTPAEKALGLQMSGDSILAKWGQPCATVSESPSGSQSSMVELPQAYPQAAPPNPTVVIPSHAPSKPQVKQSSFKKLGKKVVKPFRKAVQPLRNAAQPFREAMQPLRSTAQQPFKKMAKPLKKVVDTFRR